jgi:succinyl-CoA synthetase beta subunit
MQIMDSFKVAIPAGQVAFTAEEAVAAFKKMPGDEAVIKAQALTGGRGLGHFTTGLQGGVHMCKNSDEAKDYASKMLNQTLITKQTGEKGINVGKVFLMEKLNLKREMYFSILMDRVTSGPVIVASPAGGTSIEDVAAATPELIFKESIDIMTGPTDEQLTRLAKNLEFEEAQVPAAKEIMLNLYTMFTKVDATQVEINPLAETADGDVFACDAKINFDDNADYRNKEIHAQRDLSQEDVREVEAAKYDLNYIGLDGEIGCLVNGAGLAMATMDIIQLKGGSPANFLDVGGGANADQIQKAFEILDADDQVKCCLVNIFGGIMKCDVVATGIVQAAKNIGLKKPIVIRLEGTNVELARAVIADSGFSDTLINADDLDDGASKAVEIANSA